MTVNILSGSKVLKFSVLSAKLKIFSGELDARNRT